MKTIVVACHALVVVVLVAIGVFLSDHVQTVYVAWTSQSPGNK
jgi:hypothetical protein